MDGNVVKVVLWGETVGYLTWDKSNWRTETSVFQFDRDFLNLGWDISPIKLSISSKIARSGISIRGGIPKDIFGGLPPVFADSLPDHWGNSLFRSWAKDHKVSMKDVSSVDYLSFIGKRGMGALEYLPAAIEDEDVPFDVDVTRLYEFAKSVLDERNDVQFSTDRELLWQDLIKLGTSPGGKRPSGFDLLRKIRSREDIPVILATAKVQEKDQLLGYSLGADEYVTKPFSLPVLVAKCKAVLERAGGRAMTGNTFADGGFSVDFVTHRVALDGNEIKLASLDFDLLSYFISNRGRVLSRVQILDRIWGFDYDGNDRVVDTHIKRLRKALGEYGSHIETVVKEGYRFV